MLNAPDVFTNYLYSNVGGLCAMLKEKKINEIS